MKFASFISSLLVLGSASATVKIAIDNTKIEHTAHNWYERIDKIAMSPEGQNYTQAIHAAQEEAGLEVRQSQRAIMKPAIQDLKAYVNLFTPNKDCNVNGLAQCLNRFEATGQPLVMGMQSCSSTNGCNCRWETLPIDKKMKLEQKFGRNSQQMKVAVGALEQQVMQTYGEALQAQQANVQKMNGEYMNATASAFKDWGCNSSCVDRQGKNFGAVVEQCDCPTGIKYNETNEPFANVSVDQAIDEDTELASSGAAVGIDHGKLNANVNVNGLTTTVVLIFALQLVFCFGICCYTNIQVQQAQNREEKQKAEFYSFLYQFHKQMSDEEQAMQDLYGKQGAGGTPGAPQKLQ